MTTACITEEIFGAARNIEEGSTILATALVETGSRMDVILRSSGVNMELAWTKTGGKRIFPALDVKRSGTRREELLLSKEELELVWNFRRTFANYGTGESIEMLMDAMKKTNANSDLLRALPQLFKE